MPSLDLETATIAETSRLLQRRQLSPVELTEATLQRISAEPPAQRLHHRDPGVCVGTSPTG